MPARTYADNAKSVALDIAVSATSNAIRGRKNSVQKSTVIGLTSLTYEFAIDSMMETFTSMSAGDKLSNENALRLSKIMGSGLTHYLISYGIGMSNSAFESFLVGINGVIADEIGARFLDVPTGDSQPKRSLKESAKKTRG